MRKILCLVFLTLACSTALSAQSRGTITGKLIDSNTKNGIVGSVIEVHDIKTPDDKKYYSTGSAGSVSIASLPYGSYKLTFTYLGFKNKEVRVKVDEPSVSTGTVRLEMEAIQIDKIVIEVPALRTSQRGDTVSYNASAFKVSVDSDAEGLIGKMPGISINNGTVEAQGEEVKKVFVDGKEFFGDDVNSALKNLPAEVIDRIEVFNKMSDQAEFSGMDDGEGYKAINIVTMSDKRSGQFGKLYGSYGYPDKYIAGGNVNIFQGTSRISVIGLFNNLNQQNFSFEDILGVVNTSGASSGGGRMGYRSGGGTRGFMVRPQDGISTVQATGINYSDTWGKNRKLEVNGSYFFNHSANLNEYSEQEWFIMNAADTRYTESEGSSSSQNYNHRFNGRLDYKINEYNNIMIRPSFSYQSYSNLSDSWDVVNTLSDGDATLVKRQNDIANTVRDGFYTGLSITYRARLGKPGRTLTTNIYGSVNKNNQISLPEQYISYYSPVSEYRSIQKIDYNRFSYQTNGRLTYTEPLTERSQFSMEYRIGYNYSDSDRRTFLLADELSNKPWIFNTEFEESLSNIYNSGYLTHRISPGYRYADSKVNLNLSVTYQHSNLNNEQEMPSVTPAIHRFNNLLYFGMLNWNFNPANSLRIHLNSGTRNPSITQLQNVLDVSDLSKITSGNPLLVPTYNNRITTHYVNSNVMRGTTLTIMAGGQMSSNYIANSVYTDPSFVLPNGNVLGSGNRYTIPENMDGYWNLQAGVSYGFPVKFLSSNLNLDLGGVFAQTPGKTNDIATMTTETYYSAGVSLSSNISENIDFTVRYGGSYNISRNEASSQDQTSRFINQNATANLKWVFWKGVTFTGSAAYSQYKGLTEDYNESYVICNLYLGKKILRNQRGEISVGVNDLFNQNTNFRRTITSSTILNSTSSAIGRYYAVQFVYNLRNFGKRASRNGALYDNLDSSSSSGVGTQSLQSTPHPGQPTPGGPPMRM